LRQITLREQASTTGLTVPEAKAKAAAKRGPIVHDLVANDLVAEEAPFEMFTASSGTKSD
jgi:O-methyltransferase involved in polyketide biosynthesis